MKTFEVISTNIDVLDGNFVNCLFDNLESAINKAKQELVGKSPQNIIEDFEGLLTEYDEKSLEYLPCKGAPAIYYRSHFGNYRCVIYIKTRTINS